MSYIYDILLDFHDTLYDFYDWNTNDNIINIRKIPLYKVDTKTLKDFKDNIINFDASFLKSIEQKTEVFTSKDVKHLEHACLFCDGMEAIAVLIKNNHMKKSRLLIDEELEVLEVANRMKEEKIEYKIVKRSKQIGFKTRNELEKEKIVRQGIKKISQEKNDEKLKYIYFECFNKREHDKGKIVETLECQMEHILDKLYDILKLTQLQK